MYAYLVCLSVSICTVSNYSILKRRLPEFCLKVDQTSSLQYVEPELGASLFEIAQSHFALERTLILGVMALNKNKSEEWRANWQNTNSERFAHERYKEKRVQ